MTTGNFNPNLTPQQILSIPMQENDANAKTIADYLFKLARHMWDEEDNADGKRPFGNSGWQHEIIAALVRGGAVRGTYIDEQNSSAFGSYELSKYTKWEDIQALVKSLFDFLESANPLSFELPPTPKDWYVVNIDADYPNNGLTIDGPYTAGDAEMTAKECNSDEGTTTFRAVHIPN